MIPTYPVFRGLEIGDRELLNGYFADHPPEISEYTFTNLYAWLAKYKLTISRIERSIILQDDPSNNVKTFLPILGPDDDGVMMKKVLRDTGGAFIRVPKRTIEAISADRDFCVVHDLDNSDYLYSSNDLIGLSGKRYDGKRNLIRKFKAAVSFTYVELTQANAAMCVEFEGLWCGIRDCDHVESLASERDALKVMVDNFAGFSLFGGAILIDEAVAGIAIGEKLNPETLVVHILKADPAVQGLYQTMLNEFLFRTAKPFKYINMEQDLGLEGLRKAKLSYHPIGMVDKYKITLA